MRRPLVPLFGLAIACLLLGALTPALAAPGAYHEDERLGYKVRYPKGWTVIPMNVDEKWIAAKFLSDTKDPSPDGWRHTPEMTVITFISEVVTKSGPELSEVEGGFLLEINNPFKDYENYLDRTYRGGGWHISEDEQGEVDGVPVRMLEIKVEKLATPKRIVTWVFHTEEVDYAVQFEVLENRYQKRIREIKACLKSFKLIERTGSLTPVTTGEKTLPKDEDELTPEDRTRQRQQQEASVHEKAVRGLPDGWTSKKMGRFLVLNHADEKHAKKVVAHAEAVWKWLDKNFDYVGPGEYVPSPIIRICKDRDEERAFMSGTSWGPSIEIVTHKDTSGGAMSSEFEYVNRRLLSIWFRNRDKDLYYAFPHWIDYGFKQVLGTARAKGSKLEFKADQWELEGLREVSRSGEITPLEALVKMGTQDFFGKRNRSKEAAAFVRLLLTSRSKKVKVVLKDYIMSLKAIVDEVKAKQKADKPSTYKAPETEEEEEAQIKQRRDAWKEKEKELLTEVFDRTFGDWSAKDWKRLNDAFKKSID